MLSNNKRKTLHDQNGQMSTKRTKTVGNLHAAKQSLHSIFQQNHNASERAYQVERWDSNFSRTYRPFEVATIEEICEDHILDTEQHANVMEYLFGNERCPLVFDIEWYNPIRTPLSVLEDTINLFVNTLVVFISLTGAIVNRDDVCVEQACTIDGRKASFHVKVPSLVFDNMACEMNSFVFYFCSWMYKNRDQLDIPDIFFYQSPSAQEIIKNYSGDGNDDIMAQIKQVCEQEWRAGSYFQCKSCGVDTAIYSRGRALRIAGVSKPNKPGELARFLRPCLVTQWWSKKIHTRFLSAEILSMPVPPKESRRAWARASLLMDPAPIGVNMRVPLPQGAPWKRISVEEDNEYIVLPPAEENEEEDVWQWTLDTAEYIHPASVQQNFIPTSSSSSLPFMLGATIPTADNNNHDEFLMVFNNDDNNNIIQKIHKQGNQWLGVTSLWMHGELDRMKTEAFTTFKDIFARYWNNLMDMRSLSQQHAEESGYLEDQEMDDFIERDEDEDEEDDRKDFEAAKWPSEYISIRHIDNITYGMMFTASNVTLDPRFKLITEDARVVEFGTIHKKTIVFCPKHEMGHALRTHKPSAFVDLNSRDQRFLSCSRCGGVGMSIKETWWDVGVSEQTWKDLQDLYGERCVRFITKKYFKMKHLLRIRDDEDDDSDDDDDEDNISQHSEYSLNHPPSKPEIYVGISPMGSGKTTLLRKLTNDNLPFIMTKLGFDVMHQPSILSISPRSGLAQFTATELGLMNYKDQDAMRNKYLRQNGTASKQPSGDELLCQQDRLSICLNSVQRLEKRDRGYDIIIMDEFATMSLSMISTLMLSTVAKTMRILQDLVKKSQIVILLAADGSPRMLKSVLPFIDWENPRNLHITVNERSIGGINDHELYMSDDLSDVCRVLKKYILEGKSVYVPTNQKQYAYQLSIFCKECLGLADDEVVLYDADIPSLLKKEIIDDPEWRLGFAQKNPHGRTRLSTSNVVYPRVRVFITTPAFGVGFSVKGDLFDITIGFFFLVPQTVPGNVQHLARIRGVKEKTIICYYESRTSKSERFPHTSKTILDTQTSFEDAIKSYEALINGIETDNSAINQIPDGQLRQFAILREVQDRLSEYYADIMFVDLVTDCTHTTPHLLTSWICNKGQGPIVELPELDDVEAGTIGIKINKRDNNTLEIYQAAPRTWTNMIDLWIKQALDIDITNEESVCIKLFEELPILYRRLDPKEREKSIIAKLDQVWRAIEVMSHESGPKRLLQLDYRKYVRSQGVSTIPRGEREYQQYQLFEAWARLFVPVIPLAHMQLCTEFDAGIKMFTYIINTWRFKNVNDYFYFDIDPVSASDSIIEAVNDIGESLDILSRDDAETGKWFNRNDLASVLNATEDTISTAYAKIIRQGFRRLFGISNISVKTQQKTRLVRVHITGLKRLILLACVRRVNVECRVITDFNKNKFSNLSLFRNCPLIRDLIPSDDDLELACGMLDVDNV